MEKRKVADHEMLGMVHYPNRNEMLLYSQKGEILSWRASSVCSKQSSQDRCTSLIVSKVSVAPLKPTLTPR